MPTENIQLEVTQEETIAPVNHTTIALSLILHGEAVRYNRGNKGGPNLYDFKHMIDHHGNAIPYISSQCFKKHWREALPFAPSPITRNPTASGQGNAYTSGNPMKYEDDDLFGYMIAGASNKDISVELAESSELIGPEEQDAEIAQHTFSKELLKTGKDWVKALKKPDDKVAVHLVNQFSDDARRELDNLTETDPLPEILHDSIVEALNQTLKDSQIFDAAHFGKPNKNSPSPKLPPADIKALNTNDPVELRKAHYKMLEKRYSSCIEKPEARDVTRRTAPIRMHAPLAFSGIKKAKDFQTFSRDVALTGENSVLNPNAVGIYSGWLKTRILIEAFRVGKFYVGKNRDILEEQVGEYSVQEESNPYDRKNAPVKFVQLSDDERLRRIGIALQSLGDIGNAHGPASGALHDGSLKPRAFIGALMNCADSPFDAVWEDEDNKGTPRLNFTRLKAVLRDWDDLFQSKTLYIGIAPELLGEDDVENYSSVVKEEIAHLGFDAIVDTPRRALKTMAQKVSS